MFCSTKWQMATKKNRKNDKWLRVDLSSVPELLDALSNFVTEIGAEGVYQEGFTPPSQNSSPESEEEPHYEHLTAYLPWGKKEENIASLENYLEALSVIFPELAKPTFAMKEITAPNWGEEWKKYFHPLRVGKRIIIKPTWEIYQPADDDIVIEIDPGMAFGTGQHHSTSMCLEAMEEIFSENNTSKWEVLDLGTGTGILGIAAAKLGAKRVVGIDIDEQAVEIAWSNAILNRVGEKLTIKNEAVSSLHQPFNLVLANLTAKLLVALSSNLENLLAPGGYLVISGIIEQNRQEIEACFFQSSLRFHRMIERQEWLCYIFARE
ncbi:MAG: 50S ribosomal protein L11 methyltransferase [Syntrophobacteraceae bacterium CG23_combo_of_CG06-09_8_20_14_all_50_8]|nr:MAG: 50S ribosomal protein L11 methyltransferase [Syntrophobacteraceae bacterium CG23_combo_of_CG06-09_8_20_14_all_50_8]